MSSFKMKTDLDDSATDFRTEALVRIYRETSIEVGSKRTKLYRAMLKMIENGFWNPGDRLPTDIEFTNFLPLSLATVQAALKMLAEQKIIVRKKRQGTFVASEENLSRELVFFCFVEPGSTALMLVDELNLSVAETANRGPWTDFLGERNRYILVTRTLDVGGKFKIRSEYYFSNPRLRVLLDFPLESLRGIALRPLLHFRFGMPTTSVEWQSSFERFDKGLAHELGVPAGQTGLRYDVRLRTIAEEPLAFHRFWVPPNKCTMLIPPIR